MDDQNNPNTSSNAKPLYINGKPMPFNAKELKKILSIINKCIYKAEEQLFNEDDEEVVNNLLNELDNL